MLGHLVRKEILDSLLNLRFMLLAVFSIILMPLSAVINYEYYETRKTSFDSQYAAFTQEEDQNSALRAYRSPVLLSTLAQGTEPYMPLFYSFSDPSVGFNSDQITPGNIEAQDFSLLSTFGSFDFLFLVQVVFSLLAVLLTFDMIAGEKERGTLKALLANQVPRDRVIVGKFIGGFTVLWMAFLVGFLLLYLMLITQDARFLEPSMVGRIGFIFGISTLFLASFFCLGLMVSSFSHSPRTAIVVLLIIWVFVQLVIPKAGELIGAVSKPVRSEHQVRNERIAIIHEVQENMETEAGELYMELSGFSDLQNAFNALGSEEGWASRFKEQYQAMFRDGKQEMLDRILEVNREWEREKEAQRVLGRTISLLSPAAAVSFLITDASGTGDLAYQQYRNAVSDQYQVVDREYYSKVNSNSYRIRIQGGMISSSWDGEEVDPETLPPFLVEEPALRDVLANGGWAMGTLFFYLLVPFIVGYFRFLRYDVR